MAYGPSDYRKYYSKKRKGRKTKSRPRRRVYKIRRPRRSRRRIKRHYTKRGKDFGAYARGVSSFIYKKLMGMTPESVPAKKVKLLARKVARKFGRDRLEVLWKSGQYNPWTAAEYAIKRYLESL